MGRKRIDIKFIDDENKRKMYYRSKKFMNQLKKLVAGSILTKYSYSLTILNPDEKGIVTYSNLSKKDFNSEKKSFEDLGSKNKTEIYNESNYETSFLQIKPKKNKNKGDAKSKNGSNKKNDKKPTTSEQTTNTNSDDDEEEDDDDEEEEEEDVSNEDRKESIPKQSITYPIQSSVTPNISFSWNNRFNVN
jgi:hypothetical protein